MTGSLSTEQGVEEEEDDGEDAWFSMHPTPCPAAATTAASARDAITQENDDASTSSSVGSNKRQRANDGSAIAADRSPLSPLGESGEASGQSGASALFSMLSEYGNNDEEEGATSSGGAGGSGVLRPVPARTHRSVIVDIYDDAMTSLRKDSLSNDSVVGRLERGIDLHSASFSDAEDSVMTAEPTAVEQNSPDRTGLPPLRSKFGGSDDDDEDAAVFAGRLKRPGVTSPGGSTVSAGKNHTLLGSKTKSKPIIQFKTSSSLASASSDNKDSSSNSTAINASSVTVGGSGEKHA